MYDYAFKDGISVTKVNATLAVEDINQLLLKAKADELGEFADIPDTSLPKDVRKPTCWEEIIKEVLSSQRCECIVVIFRNNTNFFYNCDLLLSSRDLNACNFSLNLSRCLLLKKSTIYVELSNLSVRGSQRLVSLLRDMKKFLDNRVLIILTYSGSQPSASFVNLADFDYDLKREDLHLQVRSPVSKRYRCSSSPALKLDSTAAELSMCDELNDEPNGQAVHKNVRTDNREKDKDLQGSMFEMQGNIQNLKKINKQLEDELAEQKAKVKFYSETLDDRDKAIQDLKIECQSLKEKVQVLEKDISYSKKSYNVNGVHLPDTTLPTGGAATLTALNQSRDIASEVTAAQSRKSNAGPCEIIHIVFKKLKYFASFNAKIYCSDIFQCTVLIKDIDKGFEQWINTSWKGSGQSKKQAKGNAFSCFLDALKNS